MSKGRSGFLGYKKLGTFLLPVRLLRILAQLAFGQESRGAPGNIRDPLRVKIDSPETLGKQPS